MTFGYEDYVIFPLTLSLDDPNQDISISAKIDFLICADVCIPETALLIHVLSSISFLIELREV
jgi:DsbC/DsbD-like thiol-disulfide interchange protein